MNLSNLKRLYGKVLSNNDSYEESDINSLRDLILSVEEGMISEDTSATGGPSVGGSVGSGVSLSSGMGAVQSSQPSSIPGALNGVAWASGGGQEGSGDVSVPYNPSGSNRMFQKIPMGKNHGPKTGKKSREKKLSLKTLKDMMKFKPKSKSGKVMNFDTFSKRDITSKVTKITDFS